MTISGTGYKTSSQLAQYGSSMFSLPAVDIVFRRGDAVTQARLSRAEL